MVIRGSDLSSNKCLVEANVRALQEGADLLSQIQHNHYSRSASPAFESTIGAHFRHVLEHYRCFLSQLSGGTICYDLRERDQILERDIGYAQRTLADLLAGLQALDIDSFSAAVQVRDCQNGCMVTSNFARELLFLQSHTVHHYAIIGAISRVLGERPESDFGVADATREHRNTNASGSPKQGKSSCAQ